MQTDEQLDAKTLLTARAVRVSLERDNPDQGILLSAARIIRQGGVVAYPTETVYGLAVDPFNAEAVDRLQAVKGRTAAMPLIMMISQAGNAFDLAQATGITYDWYTQLSRAFWPGPLTIVLPTRPRLSCPALAGGVSVAVRVSSHPVARLLTQTVGRPITSTSANMTGREPVTTADALDPGFAAKLGLVLDAGSTEGEGVSTIIDLTGPRPVIRREGAVDVKSIAGVLGFTPRIVSAA